MNPDIGAIYARNSGQASWVRLPALGTFGGDPMCGTMAMTVRVTHTPQAEDRAVLLPDRPHALLFRRPLSLPRHK